VKNIADMVHFIPVNLLGKFWNSDAVISKLLVIIVPDGSATLTLTLTQACPKKTRMSTGLLLNSSHGQTTDLICRHVHVD
jgi:hypothetical protein